MRHTFVSIAISIHALLAESDSAVNIVQTLVTDFYPRSPCGERLAAVRHARPSRAYFYPRSPCGERPCAMVSMHRRSLYFYPRSPCGERQLKQAALKYIKAFLSTLSLRRATGEMVLTAREAEFLSTLSLRRATSCLIGYIIY